MKFMAINAVTVLNDFFAVPVVNSSTLANFSYKEKKRISDFEISEQSTWMG